MRKLILFCMAFSPSLALCAGAGGINITPDAKAILRSTNTWSASQTFPSSTTFGAITVTGCTGCGGSSGGGGASSLAVGTGSIQAANIVSSPTVILNFSSGTHKVTLAGGASAFVTLDFSSVTAQGSNPLLAQSDFNTHSSTLDAVINALSLSTTIIYNQESPDISNRTYFLHNESSGGLKSYFLVLSSPSNASEITKTKSISSADGLVMISSHITITNDPGVRKLSAGVWDFLTYVNMASIAGLTQMVVTVSTIGIDGTGEFEIVSATSAELDDLSVTSVEQAAIQQNDIAISTSDRLLVKYWARTTSALALNFSLYLQGTTHASHLNSPIGGVYKFVQLADAPSTLVGSQGKYLSVNNDQTATVFVSTITDNFNGFTSTAQTAIDSKIPNTAGVVFSTMIANYITKSAMAVDIASATMGFLLDNGSATIRGVVVSTSGGLLGGTTIQGGALWINGSSIAFNNNGFTLVFASAPNTSANQNHVIFTQIANGVYLVGSGGDSAGSAAAATTQTRWVDWSFPNLMAAGTTNFAAIESTTTIGGLVPQTVRAFDDTLNEYGYETYRVPDNIDVSSTVMFSVIARAKTAASGKAVQIVYQSTGTVNGQVTNLFISTGMDNCPLAAVQGQEATCRWEPTVSVLGWTAGMDVYFRIGRGHDAAKFSSNDLVGDLYGIKFSMGVPYK